MERMEEYADRKKNLAMRMLALSQLDPSLYAEMLKVLPDELSQQVRERVEGMKILCPDNEPMQTLARYAERAEGG